MKARMLWSWVQLFSNSSTPNLTLGGSRRDRIFEAWVPLVLPQEHGPLDPRLWITAPVLTSRTGCGRSPTDAKCKLGLNESWSRDASCPCGPAPFSLFVFCYLPASYICYYCPIPELADIIVSAVASNGVNGETRVYMQ